MSYVVAPQYEMGLSDPVRHVSHNRVERPKAIKSLKSLPRYSEWPDEARYALWLRQRAWEASLLA